MRIAISGTHRTGKSTLTAALAESLPNYTAVDEPYHLMEEDGYEFSHPPSLEDFEAQLERSIAELKSGDDDVLFDRCPLDVLGYILTHPDADAFDLDAWLPAVKAAVESLDLVVFVPIEHGERMPRRGNKASNPSRVAVDELLQEIVLEDSFNLGHRALSVEGDTPSRVLQVLEHVAGRSAAPQRLARHPR